MSSKDVFSELALSEYRQLTFKRWPFKNGSCTAKEMALAGFFQDSDNETISCYYCSKELEGWEPIDVPFEEHKNHAPYCCFVQKFIKPPNTLSIQEVIELEQGRMILKLEAQKKEVINSIETIIDDIKQNLPHMAKPGRKTKRKRIF